VTPRPSPSAAAVVSSSRGSTLQSETDASADNSGVDTYVRCGRCQTSYSLSEDDLGRGRGR
jgi:hypothetical protein